MSFSGSALVGGIVFGICGFYFLMRGKRDANGWTMVTGAALIVFPYFVANAVLLWVIGIALLALAFAKR